MPLNTNSLQVSLNLIYGNKSGKQVSCAHVADAKRERFLFIHHMTFSLAQSHCRSVMASKFTVKAIYVKKQYCLWTLHVQKYTWIQVVHPIKTQLKGAYAYIYIYMCIYYI